MNNIPNLWEKIYAFARRRGLGHHDAEDFSQDLFHKLFSSGTMDQLLALAESNDHLEALIFSTAKHLLIDQHRLNQSVKRGGDRPSICVDLVEECCSSPSHEQPDHRLTLKETLHSIKKAEESLRREYAHQGNGLLFEVLRECLRSPRVGAESRELAARLDVSVNVLRVRLSRMKSKFRSKVAEGLAA